MGLIPMPGYMKLAEGIIGDQYPVPDRMLVHPEAIVHDYIVKEMCDNDPPKGKYKLFAVEGVPQPCAIFLIPSCKTSWSGKEIPLP